MSSHEPVTGRGGLLAFAASRFLVWGLGHGWTPAVTSPGPAAPHPPGPLSSVHLNALHSVALGPSLHSGSGIRPPVQAGTQLRTFVVQRARWCPLLVHNHHLPLPPPCPPHAQAVDLSRMRLGVDSVDLMQYYWGSYDVDRQAAALDSLPAELVWFAGSEATNGRAVCVEA
jgi:hypothetical protein